MKENTEKMNLLEVELEDERRDLNEIKNKHTNELMEMQQKSQAREEQIVVQNHDR